MTIFLLKLTSQGKKKVLILVPGETADSHSDEEAPAKGRRKVASYKGFPQQKKEGEGARYSLRDAPGVRGIEKRWVGGEEKASPSHLTNDSSTITEGRTASDTPD